MDGGDITYIEQTIRRVNLKRKYVRDCLKVLHKRNIFKKNKSKKIHIPSKKKTGKEKISIQT